MNYIICAEPGKFLFSQKSVPIRQQGEVLLRIRQVGVCGTDLHAYCGNQPFFKYPRILGHELAAEILEVDEGGHDFQVGDRVVVVPYLSCKKCYACRNGKANCCSNIGVIGVHVDGGMQEMMVVPCENLMKADKLTDDEIAIVEPLSIGAHAVKRASVKKGENILVMGCGPIGMGIMKFCQKAGANVMAMDFNDFRLNYVKEKLGVNHILQAEEDPLAVLSEITRGEMAPVVFDATGNKSALEGGIQFLAHGGRYVMVGLSKGALTFHHPSMHAKEATIMCSRNATLEDFITVKKMLNSKSFPTNSFISHRVDFLNMIDEFESILDPKNQVIKAMVHF